VPRGRLAAQAFEHLGAHAGIVRPALDLLAAAQVPAAACRHEPTGEDEHGQQHDSACSDLEGSHPGIVPNQTAPQPVATGELAGRARTLLD
jgi:hypothetical protein